MSKKKLFSLLVACLRPNEKASVVRLSNAADPAHKKSQLLLLCNHPKLIRRKFQTAHLKQLLDILTVHSSIAKWGKKLQQKSMLLKAVILRDRMFLGKDLSSGMALDHWIENITIDQPNLLTLKEVIKYKLKHTSPHPNSTEYEAIDKMHKVLILQNIENYKAWVCYSLLHFIYNPNLRKKAHDTFILLSEKMSFSDRKVLAHFYELLSPQTTLFDAAHMIPRIQNEECQLAHFVNAWALWKNFPSALPLRATPNDCAVIALIKANASFQSNHYKICREILTKFSSDDNSNHPNYSSYVLQFLNDENLNFHLNIKKTFRPYSLHEQLDWRLGRILYFLKRDNHDSADHAIEAFRKFIGRANPNDYAKTWKGITRILLQLKKDAYYYTDLLDELIQVLRSDWELHTRHYFDQYICFKTLVIEKEIIPSLVPSETRASTWRSR